MSTVDAPLPRVAPPAAAGAGGVARLQLALLWTAAFAGGFVQIEPAPYELIVLAAIAVFAVTGLALRAALLPLVFLLLLQNIGYLVSLMPVIEAERTAIWTAVTSFLSITTLFFAMALTQDTERRLAALTKGYVAVALVTSAIAVLAFLRLLPGWETFILYGRASATFKDPNVFGPFLVLPGLLLVQRLLIGAGGLGTVAKLLLIAAGLFLTFSRGAWGHFASSAAVLLTLTYLTSISVRERFRVAVVAAVGIVALAGLLVALLSVDAVSEMFAQRASLLQDYDAGHTGRFGRQLAGWLMVPDYPWGVGPLQFSRLFEYEPHNSFISAYMNGGWLGGTTWLALALVTLAAGFRQVFVRTPWQPVLIAAYAAFVGEVGESWIIDVAHWRHYFLIMGIIWGLMAANAATDRRTQ